MEIIALFLLIVGIAFQIGLKDNDWGCLITIVVWLVIGYICHILD